MPVREAIPAGAPCWVDLASSEPDRAMEFYGQLFGWRADRAGDAEYGGYVRFYRDDRLVAGLATNTGTFGFPDGWSTYLMAPDVAITARSAAAAGAQVVVEPLEIPGQGSMAMLADPSGGVIGLWQPGGHTSYEVTGENGTVSYHELQTRDYPAAVEFYRTVFHWHLRVVDDSDEFRYMNVIHEGKQFAGIMDASHVLPDSQPSTWYVYFGVEDVDSAVRTAQTLGGSVVTAPEDTPFGRLATLADPTGAAFKLSSLEGPA
ncbi:MAG: VOC family protein [Microbacteriaceae bacterium]